MNPFIHTNVDIYWGIADEAYNKMRQAIEAGRRPKSDGSPGWIITYDPEQTSFKQAMISVVFTAMWFEATMHLHIVKAYGKSKFKTYDHKPYEDKLKLLGCTDVELLKLAARFQKARKLLVHEKAYFDDGETRTAQGEAENAHAFLLSAQRFFVARKG
ncbi:MAG: hypothetical protein CSYNP_01599 [Syntrophus sp. SKADARSKE-3]|nr:hypothetical protein [Syntrophus sp. SKADARSKE-3]